MTAVLFAGQNIEKEPKQTKFEKEQRYTELEVNIILKR